MLNIIQTQTKVWRAVNVTFEQGYVAPIVACSITDFDG